MAHASGSPLISCLCVTRRSLEFIQQSIQCFLSQSYSNKELIILHHNGDAGVKRFVTGYSLQNHTPPIIYIEDEAFKTLSLGELRNQAIEHCNGDYFCQWDDDDWYHNDRLTIQFNNMINNFQRCTLLTNVLIFDKARENAYLTPFRYWENSLLCAKSLVSNGLQYPALKQGEDSLFVNQLIDLHGYYPLVAPHLYIYTIHHSNTWPASHYEGIFSRSKQLPENVAAIINKIVLGQIPNQEASDLLSSKEVLSSIKFFRNIHTTLNFQSDYMQKFAH